MFVNTPKGIVSAIGFSLCVAFYSAAGFLLQLVKWLVIGCDYVLDEWVDPFCQRLYDAAWQDSRDDIPLVIAENEMGAMFQGPSTTATGTAK